ncbi:hypothetical protein [Paenibacillus sabinae]|uniref:Uncharacterized protein n=1 Tax=Paenibacillus sabinae T27 TaxID=1268072 RepID=X4ZWS0_9BACL|nr:hypothetical protein [Paenibacillus sabinae]AHV96154.1 hypothetical protein PSAB_06090 [Paenibacillus sabinae T27]
MPTLEEIRIRVFRATSGMYTDTYHMTDLINDAIHQLVEGARLRDSSSIAVTAGVNTYSLPANFKSPGALLDATSADSLVPYELVDITENRTGYAIEGGDLIIKPTPQESRTLTHYYYKYATPLVSETDVPEIDPQYHDLLAFYAAGMILLLPQLSIADKTLSDRYMNRWNEGKASFISDMQRKNKSSRARTVNTW